MNDINPTGITADRKAATLTITWEDERTCVYPFDLLRNACPCALCQEESSTKDAQQKDDFFVIPLMNNNSVRLRNIEAVGNYAITLEWEDGHKHGIYQFAYLYNLCDQLGTEEE